MTDSSEINKNANARETSTQKKKSPKSSKMSMKSMVSDSEVPASNQAMSNANVHITNEMNESKSFPPVSSSSVMAAGVEQLLNEDQFKIDTEMVSPKSDVKSTKSRKPRRKFKTQSEKAASEGLDGSFYKEPIKPRRAGSKVSMEARQRSQSVRRKLDALTPSGETPGVANKKLRGDTASEKVTKKTSDKKNSKKSSRVSQSDGHSTTQDRVAGEEVENFFIGTDQSKCGSEPPSRDTTGSWAKLSALDGISVPIRTNPDSDFTPLPQACLFGDSNEGTIKTEISETVMDDGPGQTPFSLNKDFEDCKSVMSEVSDRGRNLTQRNLRSDETDELGSVAFTPDAAGGESRSTKRVTREGLWNSVSGRREHPKPHQHKPNCIWDKINGHWIDVNDLQFGNKANGSSPKGFAWNDQVGYHCPLDVSDKVPRQSGPPNDPSDSDSSDSEPSEGGFAPVPDSSSSDESDGDSSLVNGLQEANSNLQDTIAQQRRELDRLHAAQQNHESPSRIKALETKLSQLKFDHSDRIDALNSHADDRVERMKQDCRAEFRRWERKVEEQKKQLTRDHARQLVVVRNSTHHGDSSGGTNSFRNSSLYNPPDKVVITMSSSELYGNEVSAQLAEIEDSHQMRRDRLKRVESTVLSDFGSANFGAKTTYDRVSRLFELIVEWRARLAELLGENCGVFFDQMIEQVLAVSRFFWNLSDDDKLLYRPNEPITECGGVWEAALAHRLKNHFFKKVFNEAQRNKYVKELSNAEGRCRHIGFDNFSGILHWLIINYVYDGKRVSRNQLLNAVFHPRFSTLAIHAGLENWIKQVKRIGRLMNCFHTDIGDLCAIFIDIIEQCKDVGFTPDAKPILSQLSGHSGMAFFEGNVSECVEEFEQVLDFLQVHKLQDFKFKVPEFVKNTSLQSSADQSAAGRLALVDPDPNENAEIAARKAQPTANPDRTFSCADPKTPLWNFPNYRKLVVGQNGGPGSHSFMTTLNWNSIMCENFNNFKGCKFGIKCSYCHLYVHPLKPNKVEDHFCRTCGMLGHTHKDCTFAVNSDECKYKDKSTKNKQKKKTPKGDGKEQDGDESKNN